MIKRLLSAAFSAIIALQFAAPIFAQGSPLPPSFASEWKQKEIKNLQDGKIVIRNIRKVKNASLNEGINVYADKVLKIAKDINANYLAEIIYKMPKSSNQSIISQAVKIFEDINLYKEIIYTDEKKESSKNLFPLVEQTYRNDAQGYIQIGSHLKMDMLSDYNSELEIEWGNDGFYFHQKNVTPLMWKSLKAVKAGNMIAGICCFEWNDEYYVYALGGIRAPRIPFVIAEIERQFIGRIEDFTVFYIKKFNIKQEKR